MDKQLNIKKIALIGRTFEEYYNMFGLDDLPLNEIILDVASGVSSFCAQANRQGFNVTASDKIYNSPPFEIELKCKSDLDIIIKRMPDIAGLYVWNYFKDIESLRNQREEAYKLFIEDFKKHGARYIPVEYPVTDFRNNQFNISLISHFLFLYEEHLDYEFHKSTIQELLRITSKEIRIFPIVNLKGKKSSMIAVLMGDRDFGHLQIFIKKVNYEFMKNGNEMMVIRKYIE